MSDDLDFQPGDLIGGRYRLRRRVGAGAMGVVWSARNEATDRDFALKLMLPSATSHASRFQRFVQEAKACGRLRHKNVVDVFDLGRVEAAADRPDDPRAGQPYLVMELLEGESLEDFCLRLGPLPVGTALRILADVADGLHAAHRAGVLHRDLKPANIFLHRNLDGGTTPKILDFGVSKLTRPTSDEVITAANTIVGSPAYMSPEQTMGEGEVDARSDVWSLGVILYFTLSGRLPFDAIAHRELLLQIVTTRPAPIETRVRDLPIDVAAIVARCLEPKQADRFPSARALSEACRAALASNDLPRIELSVMVAAPIELPQEDLHTTSSLAKVTLAPEPRRPHSQPPISQPPTSVRVGRPPVGEDEARFASSLTLLASAPSKETVTADAGRAVVSSQQGDGGEVTPPPVFVRSEPLAAEPPPARGRHRLALAAGALAIAALGLGLIGARRAAPAAASSIAEATPHARPSSAAASLRAHPAAGSPVGSHAASKPGAKPAASTSTPPRAPAKATTPAAPRASSKGSAATTK